MLPVGTGGPHVSSEGRADTMSAIDKGAIFAFLVNSPLVDVMSGLERACVYA